MVPTSDTNNNDCRSATEIQSQGNLVGIFNSHRCRYYFNRDDESHWRKITNQRY